jgi:hypothetical protein
MMQMRSVSADDGMTELDQCRRTGNAAPSKGPLLFFF